ncbi:hypothetical protein NPIL_447591 [Nephila pilipes]|uniref:Uncharacterized protein n=1 Tax=Nephila pilipes TaxID=299642 RepID=A0A8X6N6R8_NEPPI|nr:hypothetical protein NPIL_447591 [Nephila pilipes]
MFQKWLIIRQTHRYPLMFKDTSNLRSSTWIWQSYPRRSTSWKESSSTIPTNQRNLVVPVQIFRKGLKVERCRLQGESESLSPSPVPHCKGQSNVVRNRTN